ncbi:MAG TPA: zinc-binding dehydrogenase [Acidimicrobiales bacterium]|nr:zinc-binding dehydrogenase [Acidimicrobiales bacterium]
MKAVVTTGATGGVPVVADRPDPVPGSGEILVAVRAAGINNADLLQAAGFYPPPPGSPPDILGMELAGEVVANGPGATRFQIGDRVMAVVGGGAQATRIAVHERLAVPVPPTLTWAEAGGFPEAFTTAHDALFTQGQLGPGARVCVHGAAGGVGTAGVQLAAAVNAEVVATVRNPAHRAEVERLGAGVRAIEPVGFEAAGPFDVVLELIGAPNLPGDLASLNAYGRIVVIGVGAGAEAQINLQHLMMTRGRILASTLRTRTLEQKADAARRIEAQVLPLVNRQQIRVLVAATFPIADAAAAYARFRQGGKLGKIVLVMDDES